LLIFLNNLGDDWWSTRGARVAKHGDSLVFTSSFRHMWLLGVEVQISWPLNASSSGEAESRALDSIVNISRAWVTLLPFGRSYAVQIADDEPVLIEEDPLRLADGPPPPGERHPLEGIWVLTIASFLRHTDARGRERLKKTRQCHVVSFHGCLPMRKSSGWLYRNEVSLVHEQEDFSFPLRYFVERFPVQPITEGMNLLERLRFALSVTNPTGQRPDHSMEHFLDLPGCLGLQLALPDFGESHQIFRHNDTDHVILSGFWVAPQARSIFQKHQIDGLILDTTFKVMNKYHTAILMVVSHNVGLPVAISFGPRESFELYNRFYTVFREEFQIDLTQYVLESDQGSALKKVGLQHPRHLFCLRHVLKSLHHKGGRFAVPVGNLISARSRKELEVFVNTYTLPFIQVYRSGGPEKAQMIRCL
jgi:hypothetical protein